MKIASYTCSIFLFHGPSETCPFLFYRVSSRNDAKAFCEPGFLIACLSRPVPDNINCSILTVYCRSFSQNCGKLHFTGVVLRSIYSSATRKGSFPLSSAKPGPRQKQFLFVSPTRSHDYSSKIANQGRPLLNIDNSFSLWVGHRACRGGARVFKDI